MQWRSEESYTGLLLELPAGGTGRTLVPYKPATHRQAHQSLSLCLSLQNRGVCFANLLSQGRFVSRYCKCSNPVRGGITVAIVDHPCQNQRISSSSPEKYTRPRVSGMFTATSLPSSLAIVHHSNTKPSTKTFLPTATSLTNISKKPSQTPPQRSSLPNFRGIMHDADNPSAI